MIKMTVREAVGAYAAIEQLPRLVNVKIAHNLGVIGNKLESHIRAFEKLRDKLRRDMAEEVEEGDTNGVKKKTKKIPPEKTEEFTDELEKALDTEIEIEREPIKLADAFPDAPKGLDSEDLVRWDEKYPRPTPSLLRALALVIVE